MYRRWAAAAVIGVCASWLTVSPHASAAAVTCHGERATIVGTAGNDRLTGTAHRDVIAGRGGDDGIDGGGGDDLICGGTGSDTLAGGPGNDRLYGELDRIFVTDEETDRLGDVLRGGPGDDRLVPGKDTRPADDVTPDAFAWDLSATAVHVDVRAGTATGEGHDTLGGNGVTILGSSFDDTLDGSDGPERIIGGPGSDLVRGRGGDDRITDDSGHRAPHSADDLRGGPGDDQLTATFGRDTLRGGPGDDFLDDFDNSVDVLAGDAGSDNLVGELVAKTGQRYSGGTGTDTASFFTNHLNPAPDPATGHWDMATGEVTWQLTEPVQMLAVGFEAGDLSTWGTAWTVDGTALADTLSASGSTGTTFRGLDGDDSFSGSAYDDTFEGGSGTDHSLGMGVGDDTCISVEVFDDDTCENVS